MGPTSSRVAVLTVALALGGCAAGAASRLPGDPQARFFSRITALCGKAFAGRVTTSDAADRAMAGKPLVMHVARCGAHELRIPFHVGDDRSRTRVIRRTAGGLRLKHDHRHADGSPDPVTMYGGDTVASGTAERQEFPVDAESIALFRAQGLERSVANVWAVEMGSSVFVYELRREGRHFRVEFDLGRPVATPPMPWGWRDES